MTIENYEDFKTIAQALRPLTVPYGDRPWRQRSAIHIKPRRTTIEVYGVMLLTPRGLEVDLEESYLSVGSNGGNTARQLLKHIPKGSEAWKQTLKSFVVESDKYARIVAQVEQVRSAPDEWWQRLHEERYAAMVKSTDKAAAETAILRGEF